ncbi:MAG: tRNA A-37 threonylcarbamoyl transferase component Bud32 [Candidatus Aldehydirespiratoraceae bacterium]|jgi:tRNA A-37 threonylcarbamoyl transferase component Bud32
MASATPTIIAGRYELQRRLATGGMAEVWLAIDLTLDRKVAVKWLKPTLATDPVVAERFRREAIAAASLSHPNIVAVHDVFEQDGRQAVVMQLVDGKSLRQLLDTQNRLSPELTILIGTSVAQALDNAHAAGFVHRDVKPGNIMITPDGRVLLTDFGIAKGLHGDGSDDLTSDNIMMGTAKYLSPEQVRGKKLDGRADLYSLGLVLYECLAGRVPFLGETDADTALARLQRDPTDLARLRATLPTRLVNVVHALLSRKPEGRPANGAELIVELKAAQEEGVPEFDHTTEEQSPIAPFSAGKLVRAPSDARGRQQDRSRGMRQPTPPRGKEMRPAEKRRRQTGGHDQARTGVDGGQLPTGPVGIPGEPPHITGRVPVQASTRVATTRADAPPPVYRDRTPPAGHQRGAPARGMGQKWSPSVIVVGGLITIAIIIAIILLTSGLYGSGESSTTTTVLPNEVVTAPIEGDQVIDQTSVADVEPAIDGSVQPTSPAAVAAPAQRIVGLTTFDPQGDNEENNDLTSAALDGNPSTSWRTSCYSNQFMGAKDGVGLVASFDGVLDQALTVVITNGPYHVQFFASDAETAPTTFDAWGEAFSRSFGPEADTVIADPTALAPRHVLVLIVEIGLGDGCSDDNPYRSSIADISLAS